MENKKVVIFGKYKGFKYEKVPASYLIWFYEKCLWSVDVDLNHWIKENLEQIKLREISENK
jgi:uncharacterized protein (DUF3820 family)